MDDAKKTVVGHACPANGGVPRTGRNLCNEKEITMNIKRRWDVLHKFENNQKNVFLRKLTVDKSLQIFSQLYQFVCDTNDKKELMKISLSKVNALSKTHSMFMKVR